MAADIILVFDLDDTLYLERDFAFSGFRAAGHWLQETQGIEGFSRQCQALFMAGRRGRIFNEALENCGTVADAARVASLVRVYRNHTPVIELAPDAKRYLEQGRSSRRAIITDGPAATQEAKVEALGLPILVDKVICTDFWGREFWKPHERAFETIETWAGASGNQLVYIADNPSKDFIAPRRRGWRTVQIVRPERVHVIEAANTLHQADAVIEDFGQLDACLSQLPASRR
jgi:putative hydrolase of the HAD superfamily